MAYVGTVRAYTVSSSDQETFDPLAIHMQPDSAPSRDIEGHVYGYQHEVEVPLRAEDSAPLQGAQNRTVRFKVVQDEAIIDWHEFVCQPDTPSSLVVTVDWELWDEFGNKTVAYLVSLLGASVVRISTQMPDIVDTEEFPRTRLFSEIELRFHSITHYAGPTLNKLSRSEWFHKR